MKFSESLMAELARVRAGYKPADLRDPGVLRRNLTFVYHVIKGSENLLSVAIECSTREKALNAYFRSHLEDERDHCEWLAEDLEMLGVDARAEPVPFLVSEMVGSQYYLLYHVDCAALLGYMAVLECFPIPMETVLALEGVHGSAPLRTLRYHAQHDVDHGAAILKVVDGLSTMRQGIVLQNALRTAQFLGMAINSF